MPPRTESIAYRPRRAHHDELVLSARHLVLVWTDRKRPGIHEMVRCDSVARDHRRHRCDSTGSRRGEGASGTLRITSVGLVRVLLVDRGGVLAARDGVDTDPTYAP